MSRRARRGRLAALGLGLGLLVLAGCEAPTLPLDQTPSAEESERPYDFRLLVPVDVVDSAQHRTYHWPLGSTVRILVREEMEGRPSLGQALNEGIRRWNRAALFGEFTLSATSDPSRADAVLRWDDSEALYSSPPGCTGPTTGAAGIRGCITAEGDSLSVWPLRDQSPSRLVFRVTINRAVGLTQQEVDVFVTHELGHVVGILSHSDRREDLMWGGPRESVELSDRDRLTLRSLYQTEPDLFVAR